MRRLAQIIHVKPGEGTRAAVLFAQYFFIVAAGIAGKAARDTFFLSRYEKSLLPLMLAACAVAVALSAALYSRVSGKLNARLLFDGVNLLFLAGIALLSLDLNGHAIPGFYVWVEIIISILTLSFWLMASEVFDPRQGKRLFGLIGGGGSAAAIFVGAGIKPCVKMFGPNALVWVIAVVLVLQWTLGRISLRFAQSQPARSSKPRQDKASGCFDPYLIAIAVVVCLAAVCSQIVDFQFKMFAAEAMPKEADLAAFFGHFYALTGAATLAVQFFLTPILLARFGLLAGLLALPLFIGAGSLAVLFQPGVASAVVGKFADQSLKFTINNSSLELLWLPVPAARRKAVRPVIGGAIKSLAECAAGLSVFALVGITGLRYLSLIPLGVFTVWAITVVRLRSLYVKALAAAIEKRQIDAEGLEIDAHDPAFAKLIERSLRSGDELQCLAGLEMIQGLPVSQWSNALETCFQNGSPYLRKRVLEISAADADALSDQQVLAALRLEEPVALEAIRTATARQIHGAGQQLASMMHGAPPRLRAAAAAALRSDARLSADATQVLRQMLVSSDVEECAAAIAHLTGDEQILPPQRVHQLLNSQSAPVREAALSVVRERSDTSALAAVIACFDEPRLAPEAHSALRTLMNGETCALLAESLHNEPTGSRRKLGILQALAAEGGDAAMAVLVKAIDPQDLEASALVLRSLMARSNRAPLPDAVLNQVKSKAPALLRNAYSLNRLLSLIDKEDANTLLHRDLKDRMAQTIPVVLGVETLGSPHRALADAALIAAEGDSTKLPLLLELLDNVLAAEKRASVMPLIEPLPVRERDATGARLFPDLPRELEPELERVAQSERDWLSAIAIDYAWRTGRQHLVANLDWNRAPNRPLTNEVRAAYEQRLHTMYSTLEKTLLLKSVSLFADIPAEKLAKVSHIADETRMSKGETVMREGEFGDSLFIVADGSVVVRKGGRDLAVLKKGDCVGEMALLDHAPRSADVVVQEDAALLRIAREDFNEVAGANPEIFQAIVRLLARRLREANQKLASQTKGA